MDEIECNVLPDIYLVSFGFPQVPQEKKKYNYKLIESLAS